MNKSLLVHHIPGLNVLVDGFRHAHSGCKDYFLTHFHGDHYTGLSSDFNYGKIYCTPITGALVKTMLGVREEFIQTVPIGGSVKVPGNDAAAAAVASVAFLDAHHCPGAALLLFRVRETGKAHLHTGDMRFDPKMKEYELLKTTKIDTVFLDTTYCHPKHTFSCQVDAISEIVSQIQKRLQEDQGSNNRTLFLLSAYNIGKEKILIEVARQTGYKIPVDEKKLRILDCLGLAPGDRALFEAAAAAAAAGPGGGGGGGGGGAGGPGGASAATPLRVCRMGFCGETFPYFRPNFTNLQRYLERTNGEFTHIYSFVPTGWAASSNYNKRNSFLEKGNLAVSLVPYSEHSNFEELVEFIRFIKPRQVIPTVFSDAKDSARMVKRFQSYIDHTANKLTFFHKMKIKRGLNTHVDQQTKKSCDNSLGDQVSLEPVVSSENVIMPSSQSSSSSMMNNTYTTWEEGNKKEQLPWKSDNEFGSQQVRRLAAATQLGAMNPCRDGPSNAVLIVEEDDLPATNGQASGGGNNQYQAAAEEKMGARWACGVCTFVHAQLPEVGFLACAMCGHPRPTTATFAAAAQRHCPSGRTESSEAVSLSGTDGGARGGKAGRKTKLQSPLGLVVGASDRKAKKQKSIKDLFLHFHKN